ncbi:chorismate-binding protein [Flavobacterium sp. W20_MBD1_R3]|uniref:chorismate-binding protein n=1 Tax=Flavobacterium sp. W20_MBD1_R3 TaxID=3240278 RepID=UPI003F8ECABA
MEAIRAKSQKQFQEKLPFVLYFKPDSAEVTGFFQQNDTLFSVVDFSEKGFVLSSFDGTKTYLIPENESEVLRFTLERKETAIAENNFVIADTAAKNDFQALVAKGIQSIKNNEFKKVVLSRKEMVEVADFDLLSTFEKLVQLYPSAFVYCFYHPKIGIWLGATPEQLLKATDTVFETISLAGTQKDVGLLEIIWNKKEKEEQQFVTDYIVSKLESVASEIKITAPYSIKAGTIWHIRTDISGRLNSDSSLQKVIQWLHPTPAVCGLPKERAKAFILENEKCDRSFYTGFLGELNSSFTTKGKSSDLFVNLRCMQIEVDSNSTAAKAYLYVGCGITKDSVPEKEWEESVHKSMTMKKGL